MPKDRLSRTGFTLVELLVVISIIAILSTIGMAVFTGIQAKARDERRRADLRGIVAALEIYRNQNGRYPDVINTNSNINGRGGWGDSDLDMVYMQGMSSFFINGSLPIDPINNATYHYSYFRYTPSFTDYGCSSRYYYVIGISKFENSPKDSNWKCSGRDWSSNFDMSVGDYE